MARFKLKPTWTKTIGVGKFVLSHRRMPGLWKHKHLKFRQFHTTKLKRIAGVAQLVEHQLPKLRVAGSNPVSRSIFFGNAES